MLEKNLIKLIHSLEHRKYRKRHNLFVAEGHKTVGDLMKRLRPAKVLATEEWVCPVPDSSVDIVRISEEELAKASFLQHPQQVIGLFPIPADSGTDLLKPEQRLTLALDGVQDPGNLGTIIRLADWFGISDIVCSPSTADAYNPKVVQATMGSLARVNIVYTDLAGLLARYSGAVPIYGTLLDGDNIYSATLGKRGFIVMGNEGNGISPAVRGMISQGLLIPSFGDKDTAESLNVAIATAITCSEFMRRA